MGRGSFLSFFIGLHGRLSGSFNCSNGLVVLLRVLLPEWGEWEEVTSVPEAPFDVPLHPLLRLSALVAIPHPGTQAGRTRRRTTRSR